MQSTLFIPYVEERQTPKIFRKSSSRETCCFKCSKTKEVPPCPRSKCFHTRTQQLSVNHMTLFFDNPLAPIPFLATSANGDLLVELSKVRREIHKHTTIFFQSVSDTVHKACRASNTLRSLTASERCSPPPGSGTCALQRNWQEQSWQHEASGPQTFGAQSPGALPASCSQPEWPQALPQSLARSCSISHSLSVTLSTYRPS